MNIVYGAPQLPLSGSELVTIQQMQNGQLALCTMTLSDLSALLGSGTGWTANLPTTKPAAAGELWNNGGAVSIS